MARPLLVVFASWSVAAASVIDVTHLGAAGDGATDDTRAFEAAFARAAAAPGSTVLVPSGAFLVRPFNLTSHTTLALGANASLVAVADAAAWPLIAPAPGYGRGRDHPGFRYTSLLHGEHLVNVTIRGAGADASVIDGRGESVSGVVPCARAREGRGLGTGGTGCGRSIIRAAT